MEKVDQFVKHSESLWTLEGDWQESPLRRRMTILKAANGSLVVHSAMALPEPYLAEINLFGAVEAIVIPNSFHDSEAPWFAQRFPQAQVFAPKSCLKKAMKSCRRERIFALETDWATTPWVNDVIVIPIPGLRWLSESFLFHKASRTLVVCDLAFNMRLDAFKGIERAFMRWNRVGQGFGPSRLASSVFTRDPETAKAAFESILQYDFDRVVVSHGQIIETGGKAAFQAAFCNRF